MRILAALCSVFLLTTFAVAPAIAADPTAKCEAMKIKAAGKKYASKATCAAKAVLKNEAVSPVCLQKAEAKFFDAFAKADAKGDCDGDASAIEEEIDVCLADMIGRVTPAPTTTTTTTLVDNISPTVISADDTSATTVEVVFSEPLAASSIQGGGSDFTIDNGVAVSSASLQPDNLTVVLTTTALTDLTPYTVTVTGVTDTAGNPIGVPNSAQFTRTPQGAVIRINEVNASITNGCDLIELRVVVGGSLDGYELHERNNEVLLTFPDFTVATNDLIVVHLGRNSALCNPAGASQETATTSEQPAASFAGNYDTAYDFWSVDVGVANTDNVLTLYDASFEIVDAVFLTDDPTGAAATTTEGQAAQVAAAGEWEMIGGGVPPGGFVDDDFNAHAALDLDATGTTPAGTSIQRLDDSDDNDLADWNVGATTVQPQTFGALNSGQVLQ